ncbi:hypothetical protein TO73_1659 [Thermus aquaticus Y51MC23]|uniref:Uncharacterized protein n=1 Tax=Thermus aquaticus (strain ATCC BAA-2747 / Y51MC23) TaxID=498848 RepID=A0ABM5VMW3_THEA5|nr:hypothetical protein TO73_1659 [Thermus aquaticus Y51MC23]
MRENSPPLACASMGAPAKGYKGEDRAFRLGLFALAVSALRLILGSGLF